MLTALRATLMALLATVFTLTGATGAHADVENFHYESWGVEYELTLNEDGRVTAHVTETLVAVFPGFQQNKGIVRGLPQRYHHAPSAPRNISVTDAGGAPLPFFTEDDDDIFFILTGDDSYVTGEQTYVLKYDIPDVIFQPANASVDEFYWDMVSVIRKQPINSFHATVTLDERLTDAYTGDVSCYTGDHGSTARCEVTQHDGVFQTAPRKLGPNETMTLAIGFEPGVVVQPSQRMPNPTLDLVPLGSGTAGLLLGGTGMLLLIRYLRRHAQTGKAVITHHEVPTDLPPLIAGPLSGRMNPNSVVAEFLHLAVRGYLRIEETAITPSGKPTLRFRKLYDGAPPTENLDPLDIKALNTVFKKGPAGEVFDIPKKSEVFSQRMSRLRTDGAKALRDRKYTEQRHIPRVRALGFVTITLAIITLCLSAVGFLLDRPPLGPAFGLILSVLGVIAGIILVVKHSVLLPKGAQAREYLQGVKEFINVAEADRLRMLQSYSGAERVAEHDAQVVHVYERLLPYALLFGKQREWSKVLEMHYQTAGITSLSWYPALGIHGLSQLDKSLAGFSSSLTSASTYSSSSSGGSSGGGFAGGGGGGGSSGGR